MTSLAISILQEQIATNSKRSSADKMHTKLTPRRREVMRLIAMGQSSKEIATILNISAKTVEFHRSGLMHDLGMRNIAELVRYWVSHETFGGRMLDIREQTAANSKRSSADKMHTTLTPRQREVMRLIAMGQSSKEIATILNISAKTVEYHRTGLMQDLGMRNLAELVRYSVSCDMIQERMLPASDGAGFHNYTASVRWRPQ